MKKIKINLLANCQGNILKRAISLLSQESLTESIEFFDLPFVHEINISNKATVVDCLNNSSHIISHIINDNYPIEEVRSKNILKRQELGVKVIFMPDFFFQAYFPAADRNITPVKSFNEYRKCPTVYQEDLLIRALWSLDFQTHEAIEILKEPSLYSQEELLKCFNLTQKKIIEKETKILENDFDVISVYDFIKNNFQNMRIAQTHNHLSHFSTLFYAQSILKSLGLNYDSQANLPCLNQGNVSLFISPSVYQHLQCSFEYQNMITISNGESISLEKFIPLIWSYYDQHDSKQRTLQHLKKHGKSWVLEKASKFK